MAQAQEGTPTDQPQDQEDAYVNRPNVGWFTKNSGSTNAMRRTIWFDLKLKSEIDQNENHILGQSTVAVAKKLKQLIQKDELTIADLEGAGLEKLKQQYKNDVELEYHVDQLKAVVLTEAGWNIGEGDVPKPRSFERYMSKSTKPHPSFYNNDFYYMIDGVKRRSDNKEYTFGYADLPRLSLNDIEDMYLLKVQDKLHHLQSKFKKDFNNAILFFIQRIVIQNGVEDLQLGVESYQRTLNLTKPKLYFKEIKDKIPYIMYRTEKGCSVSQPAQLHIFDEAQ
ncbi:hypothetical protein Tco_0504799 [Tanacetum coccineum]